MIATARIESDKARPRVASSVGVWQHAVRSKAIAAALAMCLVIVAVAVCWKIGSAAIEKQRIQDAADALLPIATLLGENHHLLSELEAQPFAENGSAILESYLIKIRRDGVAAHANMKQRLDQLAENNTAIVTLIKAYAPHAKTPAFSTEADKFLNYSSAWRDRWNSVMEIFMAGGNYPVAEISFPTGFPAAADAEIAAIH
jgi:uncharacterized membrane protein